METVETVPADADKPAWPELALKCEEERDYLDRRRADEHRTDANEPYVGLALSGGGIRSATFALGVLEALKDYRLLKRIDYLSTVSGGGFIGSWLSANCVRHLERTGAPVRTSSSAHRAPPKTQCGHHLEPEAAVADAAASRTSAASEKAAAPLASPVDSARGIERDIERDIGIDEAAAAPSPAKGDTPKASTSWLDFGTKWDKSIAHLRRHSNYLSPDFGILSADTWSMLAVWLRNAMLVQATVIFAIATLFSAIHLLRPVFVRWYFTGDERYVGVVVLIMAVVAIGANLRQLSLQNHASKLPLDRADGPWPMICALAAAIVFYATHRLIQHWRFEPFSNDMVNTGQSLAVATLLLVGGYLLVPICGRLFGTATIDEKPVRLQIDFSQRTVQWVIVFPLMVTAYLVAAVLWGQVVHGFYVKLITGYSDILRNEFHYWSFPLSIALMSLWLMSCCSMSVRFGVSGVEEGTAGTLGHRLNHGPLLRLLLVLGAPVPAVLVLYLLLCAVIYLMRYWYQEFPSHADWMALVVAPSLVLLSFSVAIVVLLGMLGRRSTEGIREWWSRLGGWLTIYGMAWLIVAVSTAFGPWLVGKLGAAGASLQPSAVIAWLATTVGGLLAGKSSDTGSRRNGTDKARAPTTTAKEVLAAIGPYAFIAGLLVLVGKALQALIDLNDVQEITSASFLATGSFADQWQHAGMNALVGIAAVCAVVTGLLGWRVDINVFGLNTFYRNRLNRCYLGASRFEPGERKPQAFTGFDDDDDIPLSDLAETRAGPYHIVNCALNLGGSKDLSVHTRHSGSFILSPCLTGSGYEPLDLEHNKTEIGYVHTEVYGGDHGYPTLGQAISVSGAAANPNMGYHTSPAVAFLLTMFNARLGWWFPHPGKHIKRSSPRLSLGYLGMELLGAANDKRDFLNVSDGGHFENLGAYELVRRRCGIIIVSDAECDPDLACEGLAQLIRMCDVDFGAVIDIDVRAIRRQSDDGWSDNRCAVGTISYFDEGKRAGSGILIYFKASMNGLENPAILQYKATHPTFPHETTGDQFYGEAQFESYRHLGRDIVDKALRHIMSAEDAPPKSWNDIADALQTMMTPSLATAAQFTRHGQALMSLWTRLGNTPALRLLESANQQLVDAEWTSSAPPARFRPVYFLCNEILQLMENVYMDLDLENTWSHPDNAGWKNTFEAWASLPVLRRTWATNHATFGTRFQQFCKTRLGLQADGKLRPPTDAQARGTED